MTAQETELFCVLPREQIFPRQRTIVTINGSNPPMSFAITLLGENNRR